jgi:hypothetical protein
MTEIENSSPTIDYLPPPSPIQRILIAHLNLYASCHRGETLGEDASLEELSEEIFFYHRGSPIGLTEREDEEWNLTTTNSNGNSTEEAVSFLGLCKALYTLPSSLNIPSQIGTNDHENGGSRVDSDDDRTNAIYFGNSMLVFVPLESTLDVVAVVQVSRLYQNAVKFDTGSGNPLAISASIEKTHRLFCILHGGGIAYGLGKTKEEMQMLFALLKEIREYKHILSRQDGPSTSTQNAEIAELESEFNMIKESSPIQYLRRDLESHYNEYLSYFLEVCIRNGGAGRCLVETMPVPIAQANGSHIFRLPPFKIQPRCLESFGESIQQVNHFIQSHYGCLPNENASDASLLGIAVFKSSQLLYSYSNSDDIDLSNDTVNLLMAYMASYKIKMRYVAMSNGSTTSVSSSLLPDPHLALGLLKRLSFHLGPMGDKTQSNTAMPRKNAENDVSMDLNHQIEHRRGRFLPSPPSFMLGASDQLYTLSYENNQEIWAPRVHLALGANSSRNEDAKKNHLEAHMVVFEFLEFSFLIFIHLPSLEKSGLSEVPGATLLLTDLEKKLSEAVITAFCDEPSKLASLKSISTEHVNEPGQDVVLVERSKERLVLLLDPNFQTPRSDKLKRAVFGNKNRREVRHFMGFGPRKKEDVSQPQPTSNRSRTVEWSALGLDCRHLLASRLPLDICLAFDDMINEVRNAKRTRELSLSKGESKDDELSSSILELCTCMPYGWIYALATETKELYVFFNSAIYVTVADVQSAVLRLKERYMVSA